MTKFVKRYFCCTLVVLILIFMVYYRFYGRFQFDRIVVSSDEFIAVAYVLEDDDDNHRHMNNENQYNLLNLTDFRYKLQPSDDFCKNIAQDLLAILVVTSYVGHDELRSAHRTAISNSTLQHLGVVRVFLLAEIPAKEKFITQEAIESEHQHFNDIVQGNFIEAYRHLPYKHVMGLQWAAYHQCLRPKYIIKMDDDIVVDFYHLIEYLSDHKLPNNNYDVNHFLSGYIFHNVVPIRQHQNKWFVTEDEFNGDVYPDYLSGWMYVTIPRTAKSLVAAASEPSTPIFWIDDTWITGILRTKRHIPIDDSLNEFFSANSQFLDCCIADIEKHRYKCPFIAGPNGGDHTLIKKFHQVVNEFCFSDEPIDLKNNQCVERDASIPSLKKTCVGSDKHLLKEIHGAAIINAIRL